MNSNPIVIVGGEPQSIFIEIFLKSIKKIQHPIILISSKDLLIKNLKKFNYSLKFNQLNKDFTNIINFLFQKKKLHLSLINLLKTHLKKLLK